MLAALFSAAVMTTAPAMASPETSNIFQRDFSHSAQGALKVSVEHPAQQLIETATQNLLAELKANSAQLKAKPELIYPILEKNILGHFDFKTISRAVLGIHWRRATDTQKARFEQEFRNMMVRKYASAMLSFSNQKVSITPFRPSGRDDRAIVNTKITQTGGPDIAVNYVLFKNKQNEWKVYDINIEGISLVLTHRSEYSSAIRSMGGLDALIDKLSQMNKRASGPRPAM
jgi:phospholipid transport system substrate-binding protein